MKKNLSKNNTSTKSNKGTSSTRISMHAISNVLDGASSSSEDLKNIDKNIYPSITRINLSALQMNMMAAILRGFTSTGYKGNISQLEDRNPNAQPLNTELEGEASLFEKTTTVPILRITQKRLLDLAGINQASAGEKERAIESIIYLKTRNFFIKYSRLIFDKNGEPMRDEEGNWKKETQEGIYPLFDVRPIKDERSGILKYYEIIPSQVFLDQVDKHYTYLPKDFNIEIKKLLGSKKASRSIFLFFYFLSYSYGIQVGRKKTSRVKISLEKIFPKIGVSTASFKNQRKRSLKILDEACDIALKLNYLLSWERTDKQLSISINHEKFQYKEEISMQITQLVPEEIFNFFHKTKNHLDLSHKPPTGIRKDKEIVEFEILLNERKIDDIKQLINWALTQKYWCSRLGTVARLRKNFHEGWTEYVVSTKSSSENRKEQNKAYIENRIKGFLITKGFIVDIGKNYVEFKSQSHPVSDVLGYDQTNFTSKCETFLKKWCKPKS